MSRKIARITQDKKLLLANEAVEDNRYSLNEHGKLYTKNILEGNKFSIDDEFIEVGEFIEGYPFTKPVIDDSLVLWLDGSTGNNYEQTGTWKDLSDNGNDGQLINFGFTEDSGWVDGGLKFDGVDDYVNCGNDNILNSDLELCAEALVTASSYNHAGAGGFPRILSKSYGSIQGYQILINSANSKLGIELKGGTTMYSNNSIPLNEKVHIAFTYSTSNVKIYINGVLDKEFRGVSGILASNSTPFIVGDRGDGGRKWSGEILLVRIYNRALTDEEILQNYQAGQCSPLLAMRGDV